MPPASDTRPAVPRETRERIYSPLQQLRSKIRLYITLEALAFLASFVGLWYWLGLGLDYLGFKTTGLDIVQVLPYRLRAAVLVGIVGVLVVLLALRLLRLFRDFRPESLALVLERRFPELLGDRLITAVELASDLDAAEKFGYSRAMILETVREVSARVDRIPMREVFNWKRLRGQWLYFAAAMVCFSALAFASDAIAHRSANVGDFAYRLADVSQTWFERNILLLDTLWPRRAYLEFVDFPLSGELRIGRDAPSPRIRVRALKWVIADRAAADGWRALTWADLTPSLLGGASVPDLPTELLVPPVQGPVASEGDDYWLRPVGDIVSDLLAAAVLPANDRYWTLDRLESMFENPEVREVLLKGGLSDEKLAALLAVFPALERKAADPRMSRKLRKLKVPQAVIANYWGKKSSNEVPLARQQENNEFAGVLSDLKESVKFHVKGEDYVTYPNRLVTLVPAPMLTRLERDEELPAYHFLRPPADGKAEDLKGKKLVRTAVGVSLTGSTSRLDMLTGSNLVLRGEVDKDLAQAIIRYRSADKSAAAQALPAEQADRLRAIVSNSPNWTTDQELLKDATLRQLKRMLVLKIKEEIRQQVLRGTLPPALLKDRAQAATAVAQQLTTTRALDELKLLLAETPDKTPDKGQVTKSLEIKGDRKMFEERFENITRPIEFDFEFTDTDNVKSLRHIVIQPVEDHSPKVDLAVETIRKTNLGYMCTPVAMIPFGGRVSDDSGLTRIEYSMSYSKVESAQASAFRAAIVAGVLGVAAPAPLPLEVLTAPAIVDYLGRLSESREPVVYPGAVALKSFEDAAAERNRDPRFLYGKDRLDALLREPPQAEAMIRQFELRPSVEFLDLLERIPELRKAGENVTLPPRFKMRLNISATDNNIETGPHTGQNAETFTFLVVPYEQLLGEIAKDEEGLGAKMEDLYNKMLEARAGIEKVLERTPRIAGSDDFRAVASRMLEIEEAVAKGHDVTQEILNESNRLLKELQINRVPESHIKAKETICNRLDEALRILFPRSEEAQAALRKALDERTPPEPPLVDAARQRQDELLLHLKETLDKMGQAELINKAAARLQNIINSQVMVKEMVQTLLQDEQDRILDAAGGKLELKAEPVVIPRGEKKVVTIDLGRNQLDGRLVVKLVAPAGSGLTVPPSVKVPRLGNQMQFELEASKSGEFMLQITPQNKNLEACPPFEQKPFELKVTVK